MAIHNTQPVGSWTAGDPLLALTQREPERDELTGFITQSCFTARLEQAIGARLYTGRPLTLVLLQLANFYEIASWVGTAESRQLLTSLAGLLEKTVPAGSWLCRCRNHEFALLLVDDGSRRVTEVAAAIHRALHQHGAELVPPQLNLACGIGAVRIDAGTPDSEVAFARARHAIRQHRSTLPGDDSPLGVAMPFGQGCGRRVLAAIEDNRLGLTFQGTVGFRTDAPRDYEARVVLQEDGGSLPAENFVEGAVRDAVGEKLDRWVCTRAIELLRAEPDPRCRFTVTVSQNSLVSPTFVDWLGEALPASLAGRLAVQVSEIDALSTQHHLARFSQAVAAIGLELVINHFGATEDPLRYLTLLPARRVSLHRSRLQQLADSLERQQDLAGLINALHQRNIAVIAGGIEKFSDLPLLWEAGIDFIQGYCIHRPSAHRDCEFIEEVELTLR